MSWVDSHEPDEEEIQSALDDLYGELRGVRLNTDRRKRRKRLDHDRKGKPGRTSPVIDYVRKLGPYLVVSEVAEELGVSPGLVRKLANQRVTQAPSYKAPFGNTHVKLFTKEDVEALREFLDSQHKVYPSDQYPEDK